MSQLSPWCWLPTAGKLKHSISHSRRKQCPLQGPLGQTPTMCEQDDISFCCPSCKRELSCRYGMLEPCRNRGHCYVHRSQREETVFTECESCAQGQGERDHEKRRREAERSRRDRN